MNRQEYITAQASEKIVLAHVHATTRFINWTIDSGAIYKRTVNNYVIALKQEQTILTEVLDYGSLIEGSFYYNSLTNELFVWCNGSVDPSQILMIGTFRFFYSNAPITSTHDLTTGGNAVLYLSRITNNPGYKHKVGIEQSLTSLIGTGELVLENNDGLLDESFDTLFFENQVVEIYSYNRNLSLNDIKKIYRGRITNKSFDGSQVKYTVKDQIYDLDQPISQELYDDSFNIRDDIKTRYKRIIYGKVQGLRLQSVDQIQDGYLITGTVASTGLDETLTGTGTLFLSELSPGDTLIIGEQELGITSIESDTSLTLDDIPDFGFINQTAIVQPEISTTQFNRQFLVSGHACSRIVKTVVSVIQLNRIELNSVEGLFVGDFLEFASGERRDIRNFNGNIVVLSSNLISAPAVSSNVIRQPIENVFVRGKDILSESYSITNLGTPDNKCLITLDDDIEFQLARTEPIEVALSFTNGTRLVTTASTKDLTTILKPRDFIRPDDINYTTFYEVLRVEESQITLRTVFTDPTFSGNSEAKKPDYIDDDTIVSATVYGKTIDGEPNSTWIKNASQVVKDIVSGIDIININNQSFIDASNTANQTISMALPLSVSGGLTKAKDAIDLVNKSVFAALTLDNNLDIQYRILQNDVPENPIVIQDKDVINWDIKSTNGKTYTNIALQYRFQDINPNTLESTQLVSEYSSEFVRDYIGTDITNESKAYLFETRDADIMAHRLVYFNRLGRSDITIKTDLRLENIEIGDTIQLDFDRLYKRLGSNVRKKLMKVVGLTKNGESLIIEASDLGNTFNSTCVITPNTAPDYIDATQDEKLKYGYITDNRGIVENDELTATTNLIS